MNKSFLITGVITAIAHLLLNGVAFASFLKDFYERFPPVSGEFQKQLARPPDQLIVWAMVVTTLAFGFFITLMMKWSGARTFYTGLKSAFPLAFLFWTSVNFGLYASSNFFSGEALFADLACSITAMTISGAVSAWLLGLKTEEIKFKVIHHALNNSR